MCDVRVMIVVGVRGGSVTPTKTHIHIHPSIHTHPHTYIPRPNRLMRPLIRNNKPPPSLPLLLVVTPPPVPNPTPAAACWPFPTLCWGVVGWWVSESQKQTIITNHNHSSQKAPPKKHNNYHQSQIARPHTHTRCIAPLGLSRKGLWFLASKASTVPSGQTTTPSGEAPVGVWFVWMLCGWGKGACACMTHDPNPAQMQPPTHPSAAAAEFPPPPPPIPGAAAGGRDTPGLGRPGWGRWPQGERARLRGRGRPVFWYVFGLGGRVYII